MLNDKIIFWWDENSDLFVPVGGGYVNPLMDMYWDMEHVRFQDGYPMTFNMVFILLISG